MKQQIGLIASLLVVLPIASAVVTLRPVSTISIPYEYNEEVGLYGIDEGASEQSGYDATNKIAYTGGDSYIHITDWSNVTTPTIIHRMTIDFTCNDIETCGDFVAFVLEGNTKVDPGTLQIYSLYDKTAETWSRLQEIPISSKPDMLHFSHDCLTILVANKGIAKENAEKTALINPEGTISIIRLSHDGSTYNSTLLNFTQFNDRADEYVGKGVRYSYRGQLDDGEHTFSQNMEPEYITYNKNNTKAYVALQKNNAIAVIDLTTDEIENIYPLGEKSWSNLYLDASDKDGGIVFQQNDIFSFFQPDGIKYFEVDGVGYIITANEGNSLDYELGNDEWTESQRGNDFKEGDFSSTFNGDLITNVSDNKILGRLMFSKVDGKDDQDKFEKLYFFGARGFSIFRASNMTLVYDSGDEVEKMIAKFYPDVFNTDTKPDDADEDKPIDFFDKRSDNKGPECESVEIGELDGRRILFVGVDRTSVILIYSLEVGQVVPTFETVYRAGGINDTFQNLLNNGNLGDLDPEDMKFIPGSKSVTGVAMLMVTSTVSGTISLYEVYDEILQTNPTDGTTADHTITMTTGGSDAIIFFSPIVCCISLVLHYLFQ
nr:mesenchyme-specific cell surface glycoprotein-like [Lytechinus pictus]